ncbi:hypothetical protein [Candidatus Mycoplasma haematohominis]|uniref:hypothetical protein n=1 Tax=Candidatus Mycoplasma haematohominis TaxID=1494318 RepID=UPI001C0A69D6|nr:hypothetical protein [Candidatus Mycoplasma haemohominis]
MLKETKITLSVAAIGGNSAIGIYFNEFLRLYLFMTGDSDELSTSNNDAFKIVKTARKKVEKVIYKSSTKNSSDPRKSSSDPQWKISDSTYQSHTRGQMWHISSHKNKLVDGRKNDNWWKSIYKQRTYIMKNQDINIEKIEFVYGFSATYIPDLNSRAIYMNQFCYLIYGSNYQYKKYKDLFWLICSIDGVNPEEKNSSERISQMQTANFPIKNSQMKQINYMTLDQAKKKATDKNKFGSINKSKYVVYDYSEEWWKWSYEYVWQKDQKDEESAYPLSEKFRKVQKGWDDQLGDGSLNKVCKDFYENTNSSNDEKEDASRYCSAEKQ